jgi:cyclopropane-fatty-acyl-phospholipid synthase
MLAKYNVETHQGTSRQDSAIKASIEFLDHLSGLYPRCHLKVRFWDDTIWNRGKSPFTLVLKHPGALRSMFLSPRELRLGECYIFNDFDIEGDAEAACELADYLLSNRTRLGERLYLATILCRLPANGRPRAIPRHLRLRGTRHSPERDRQAISYHYDLPPSFYSLFLDARMLYSCAYFRMPEDGLEQAQEQKLDYICRKLRLSPGDCLLDIGCGWGGLIMYAASHYQVKVVGITLSTEQAEFARKRIRELGLEDRCLVELSDYRQFKAFANDGALEQGTYVPFNVLMRYSVHIWEQLEMPPALPPTERFRKP